MSTFRGIVSEIDGISVDRFDNENLLSRAFFLSHCHSDHMVGLSDGFLKGSSRFFLYASEISCVILRNKYPGLNERKCIIPLNLVDNHTIEIPGRDEDGDSQFISVRLITAGHCPGSVMFLFQTKYKTILYTGDFRYSPKDLLKRNHLNDSTGVPITIDKLYFDSTFWNENYSDFPGRKLSHKVISDVIREWITKGKEYVVFIKIPAYYGSEYLYMDISNEFKMPIHVMDTVYKTYRQIGDMESTFTLKPENTQIFSCLNNQVDPKKKLRDLTKSENLIVRQIKPSALKWKAKNSKKASMINELDDEYFEVCYSNHCSFNELKGFIAYLKPKSVEPCVVPTELVNEFYESIQKNCEDFLDIPCVPPNMRLLDLNTVNTTDTSEVNSKTIFNIPSDNEDELIITSKKKSSNNIKIDFSYDTNKRIKLSKNIKLFD